MTAYVETFKTDMSFEFQGTQYQIPYEAIRETYLKQSNNIFNEVWLEHLQTHDAKVLKDSKTETLLFFRNVLVIITKEGVKAKPWNEVHDFCIWEKQQIPQDFEYDSNSDNCQFARFIRNVTGQQIERTAAMRSAIGYLMNYDFKPSGGQAVVLYDESITDSAAPQGGSGKGLLANALKQVRDVVKVDGKHLDAGNRFKWESLTPSTQVAWLDDVKSDFDFSMLFSNLTDGWTVERKYLSQFQIPVKDSPKVLICSNSIIKGQGSSHVRRQFTYELSDHYSKQIIRGDESPIEKEHGGLFFSTDWAVTEWNQFFSVMCDCAWLYLKGGIILPKPINIEYNRLKQSTNEDFVEWCEGQSFITGKRYQTRELFIDFQNTYYGQGSSFYQRTFTTWIKCYGNYNGWETQINQANGLPYFLFNSKSAPF
jgi:hypothetical protein